MTAATAVSTVRNTNPFSAVWMSIVVALAMIAGIALQSPARAGESPEAMIERLGGKAITILADPNASPEQRTAQFEQLFTEGFDVDLVARIVLGRYWRTASDAEKQAFTKVFHEYIVQTYASRLNSYSGQVFEVAGSSPINDRETMVHSHIQQPGGDSLKVDWRILDRPEGPRIVDVIVEGVSMAISQRSEFAAVISQNGGQVSALIDRLRAQTGG